MTQRSVIALHAAIICLAVGAACAGCGRTDPGPSQAEVQAASNEARDQVVRSADDTMAAFQNLSPDRTLTPETGWKDHQSFDCGDTPAPTGKAIEWVAHRSATVDEGEPTETLLDPVVDKLIADGWEITDRKERDSVLVQLTHDGYRIEMSGDDVRAPGYPPRVSVSVYSPCLAAPTPYPED